MHPHVLAHEVAGEGPALLLLNGGLMSVRAWDAVAARLEPRFTVVRCDFRGQLLSPGEPPASLRGHAEDVVRLLDELGLAQVHVVGASFGALVALVLAATFPARTASLVAMTATERVTADIWEGAIALIDACDAALRGSDPAAVFDLIAISTFSPEFRHRSADQLAARRQAVASLPNQWFAGLRGLLAALQGLDLRPLLPNVTCPTLVLAAGEDRTFPLPHSQALAAELPNARLHVVPRGSHGMVMEEPQVVAESILDFVDEVERRRQAAGP